MVTACTLLLAKEVYTVGEAAAVLGLSPRTIIRLFELEPGVLILDRPEDVRNRKRRYRSIRIPRAVLERVIQRLSHT